MVPIILAPCEWQTKIPRMARSGILPDRVGTACNQAWCLNDLAKSNNSLRSLGQGSQGPPRHVLFYAAVHVVAISLFLLDREFYSTDMIRTLDSMSVRYLIPCVNTGPVKRALARHASTGSKKVSRMSIFTPEKVSASY